MLKFSRLKISLVLLAIVVFLCITIWQVKYRVANNSPAPAPTPHVQPQLPGDDSFIPQQFCDLVSAADECLIESSELSTWFEDESNPVIDIRSADAYSELHPVSSLNFSANTIKTKDYLRSKNLLLIGEAYERSTIERTCIILRGRGFNSVHVLLGGLPAWISAGGELVGNTTLLDKLHVVGVASFVKEVLYRPWLIIDASTSGSQATIKDLEITTVPLLKDASQFVYLVQQKLEQAKKEDSGIQGAILLDQSQVDEGIANVLEQSLSQANLFGIYIVEGGIPAMNKYLEENAKMRDYLAHKWERMKCDR